MPIGWSRPKVPSNQGSSPVPVTLSALNSCSAFGLAIEKAGSARPARKDADGLDSVMTALPPSSVQLLYRLTGSVLSSLTL